MSWTNELYQVYEKNKGRTDCDPPLLPLSHSTANAQIEIVLSEDGDFVLAKKVDKTDAVTVIPVTEDSGARASGIFPHPLADKLIYIAGDYNTFVQGDKDNTKFFETYIKQLEDWKNSAHSHNAVATIHSYLEKGAIIKDLINCEVLEVDKETGKLNTSSKIAGISQESAFVRFKINYLDLNLEPRTWIDSTLFESFILFYSKNSKNDNLTLCYATGNILPATYKHPSKIRNAGDKAKLISTNDENGYAFRGRFKNKEQAISVSREFSQKCTLL